MFEIGEIVYVNGTKTKGTVLEIDAGLAYIELTNGVEMEYKVKDLISEEEVIKQVAEERKFAEQLSKDTKKITPGLFSTTRASHKDNTSCIRVITMIEQIYPDMLLVLDKHTNTWDQSWEKVNKLADITGTPVAVWLGGSEDKGLLEAVIRKTLLNTVLSNSNLIGDMLIAKCQKAIEDYKK